MPAVIASNISYAAHLVLDKRISLTVSLQTDTLTQLIHIVDVIHPLAVDHLQTGRHAPAHGSAPAPGTLLPLPHIA